MLAIKLLRQFSNVWYCNSHHGLNLRYQMICSSSSHLAGAKWRLERGLGKCGNEYGPLTDIPDWSYADGRPAPSSIHEKLRQHKNKELALKAVRLMDEMKDAKRRYAKKLPTQAASQKDTLSSS